MNKKYNEIMDHVKVDAEMRERILRSLEQESQDEIGSEILQQDGQKESGSKMLEQEGQKESGSEMPDQEGQKESGKRRLSFFGRINKASVAIAAILALVLIGSGYAFVTLKSGEKANEFESLDDGMMMADAPATMEETAGGATNNTALGQAGTAVKTDEAPASATAGELKEDAPEGTAADEDAMDVSMAGGDGMGGTFAAGGAGMDEPLAGGAGKEGKTSDGKTTAAEAAATDSVTEEAAATDSVTEEAAATDTATDTATEEPADKTASMAEGAGENTVSLIGDSNVSVKEMVEMVSANTASYVQGGNSGTSSAVIPAQMAGYDGMVRLEWKDDVIEKVVWRGSGSKLSLDELAELISAEVGQEGKLNGKGGAYAWKVQGKSVVLKQDLSIEVTIK